MKKAKVDFEYNGIEVRAWGLVTKHAEVISLQLVIPDEYLPIDRDTHEIIDEYAKEYLIDKVFSPEVEF